MNLYELLEVVVDISLMNTDDVMSYNFDSLKLLSTTYYMDWKWLVISSHTPRFDHFKPCGVPVRGVKEKVKKKFMHVN